MVEKENKEKSEQEDMMVFLKENLDKEEYSSLKGIMGVRDIIYDHMTFLLVAD